MRVLTESELRFQIRLALQKLPRAVLQDLAAKLERHERGTSAAVEILFQHFSARHQVVQIERVVLDFADMGSGGAIDWGAPTDGGC
jgi:hypothetical protein